MNKLVIVLIVFLLLIFSFMQVDLRLSEIIAHDNLENIFRFLAEFFPPHTEKDFLKAVLVALWETLAISIVGTLLSAIFGLILAYFSSEYTDTLVGKIFSDFCKFLLNILRSIPELVWAALLIISAGLGPFAGCLAIIFHTTGVLGRLFSDAIENVPPESSRVLRINGVSNFNIFLHNKISQLTVQFSSYILYRWENNIRVASVLGLVGAGGLGQLLSFHLGLFLMDQACTVILAMLLLILFVDGLSYSIRRRIY